MKHIIKLKGGNKINVFIIYMSNLKINIFWNIFSRFFILTLKPTNIDFRSSYFILNFFEIAHISFLCKYEYFTSLKIQPAYFIVPTYIYTYFYTQVTVWHLWSLGTPITRTNSKKQKKVFLILFLLHIWYT